MLMENVGRKFGWKILKGIFVSLILDENSGSRFWGKFWWNILGKFWCKILAKILVENFGENSDGKCWMKIMVGKF